MKDCTAATLPPQKSVSKKNRLTRMLLPAMGFVLPLFLNSCGMVARVQNYRLTAKVEVGGKIYTGSSVQKLSCKSGGGILRDMDVANCYIDGEAVPVDVGTRGKIYIILLSSREDPKTGQLYLGTAEEMLSDLRLNDSLHEKRKMFGSWQVEPSKYPAMITFKDSSDPQSVEMLNPSDLSARFGTDTKFKSLSVELTGNQPTKGQITALLPWLKTLPVGYLNGRNYQSIDDQSLSAQVSTRDLAYWS